jgi:uncharacterized protein YjiS (DUF1127 family)
MKKTSKQKALSSLPMNRLMKGVKRQARAYLFQKMVKNNKRRLLALSDHLLRDIGFECQDRVKCQSKELKNLRRLR